MSEAHLYIREQPSAGLTRINLKLLARRATCLRILDATHGEEHPLDDRLWPVKPIPDHSTSGKIELRLIRDGDNIDLANLQGVVALTVSDGSGTALYWIADGQCVDHKRPAPTAPADIESRYGQRCELPPSRPAV